MTLVLHRSIILPIAWLDKVPLGLMVLFMLESAYLGFDLTGNEEHYFALSKQFVDPGWIPEADNLAETAGARLFYHPLVEGLLHVLSFEATVF